jgi:hypothetical protein
MRATETVARLVAFDRRGAGTDAERRAAVWLAAELARTGREVKLETFWCRPNWALAHAWHVALALAGGLVSVSAPRVGIAMLTVALVSIIADALTGVSPGRRLTPERASQNVVPAPPPAATGHPPQTRLIVTANYDAGRMGLVYGDRFRRIAARLRRTAGPLALGWLGCLCLLIVWLLAVAFLRAAGLHGIGVSLAQLPPSVVLVLAIALLLELAGSGFGPAAGDNGSGTAAALSLVAALDAARPRHLAVELVLQGAGDGGGIGLRRHLRARRSEHRSGNAVVLGIGACGVGAPRWWVSEGALRPLRYAQPLTELCGAVAGELGDQAAAPHRGRGSTPALQARLAGLAATTIGCLDNHGLVPRSHQPGDRPELLDAAALDQTTQFGLILVDALDAYLAARRSDPVPTPA